MPKIKFSTLVSGMSGKSNGSVFASNNGGSYFRTNGSKIKPKTASNSVRKSLFTGVSQAWRSLTSEQQTAWNDSVDAFIVQNAFGDNRTPSGYEVFTRLNNTRATYGSPLLVNPPTPRDLPAVGELTLDFPDLFQFYPNFSLSNFNRRNPDQIAVYQNSEIMASGEILQGQYVTMLVSISNVNQSQSALTAERIIWDVETAIDSLFEVVLIPGPNNKANIRIAGANSGTSFSKTTTTLPVDLTRPFHVGVYMSPDSLEEMFIVVDGVQAVTTQTQSGVFTSPEADGGMRIGRLDSIYQQRTVYSDVRFYDLLPTTTQMLHIGFGYVIGSELYAFPFDSITDIGTVINVTTNPVAAFQLSEGTPAYSLIGPFSSQRVPLMDLTTTGTGIEFTNLNIYATSPMSFGKTGVITNFRLIASLDWQGVSSFRVSDQWRERFVTFSPGGYIYFYVQVFDTSTGVIPALKVKPKKPRRFKAGADMSDAVS